MLRVAKEVRIFPLLTFAGRPSPHVNTVCEWLAQAGWKYEVKAVDYEFQRDGNQMLQIWRGSP
jgi:hypothetical protein